MAASSIEIKVCLGTSGNAAGGEEVLRLFKQYLVERCVDGEVDRLCSYKTVGCRGFCSKDVLVDVVVDGNKTTYQSVTPEMVERIVQEHVVDGTPVAQWTATDDYSSFHKKQYKIVLGPCGEIDPERIDDYIGMNGYRAARKALTAPSRSPARRRVNPR